MVVHRWLARLVTRVTIVVAIAPAIAPARAAGGGQGDGGLTLRGAVAEALRRSPALWPAEDAMHAAEIQQRVAESAFSIKIAPSLSAGTDVAGLARQDFGVGVTRRLHTGGEARLAVDSFRYGSFASDARDLGYMFSFTQPLLRGLGPSATADRDRARRATAGSARARHEARQQVVLTVAQAYFSVVSLQRLVHTAERAFERATTLRAASEARTKVGLSTQLDVLRADLLVLEAEASVADQREALLRAIDQLKTLIGRPLDAPLEIAFGDAPLDASPDASLDASLNVSLGTSLDASPNASLKTSPKASPVRSIGGLHGVLGVSEPARESPRGPTRESMREPPQGTESLVALALATRPDVLEARDRIGDAERARRIAQWDLLPRVDFNVSYARRGLGSTGLGTFGDLLSGWRTNVAVSYNLDRSAAAATDSLASIAVQGARRAVWALEQQVAADVTTAVRAQARAATRVAIQTKAVDVAERQLRLAQLRYERGLAGNFDIVDAENNLFRAQATLLTAETDRALARLVLERALGTLDPERFVK